MAVRKLNNYLNVISENLKIYRKQKRYSQAELVRDLNLLGINMHKNDIYLIETNQRTVKDYELWGFMKVLEVSFEDLTKGIEEILNP
ncbi:MAG: helix-turn-helix transcriptional regulator [Clostridia bacterium]|nr:helix-turn-helix transcriptional regulator [Clostridia bacterium]